MITAGFAYNQKLAITNGVREGSRFGATLPVPTSCASGSPISCWLKQVADVTQSSAEGDLASSAPNLSICVAYVNDTGLGTDATTKLTRNSSGDSTPTSGPCYTDDLNGYRRVQVTGSRDGKIEFLVTSMTPTLSSQAVTKFEAARVEATP
jgi:hypothetical protein